MSETITIDGKDYEVLTLDRIGEITHAKLAGGKVVDAKNTGFIEIQTAHAEMILDSYEMADLGIQPLKLIERKPVEFVGEVVIANFHGSDLMVVIPRSGVELGMKFRCVQIAEEEA